MFAFLSVFTFNYKAKPKNGGEFAWDLIDLKEKVN